MTKKELWLQIKNYHFHNLVHPSLWDSIATKFSGRNPFTQAFANKIKGKHNFLNYKQVLRAIGEYKKFVYLGVISDCHVTPSKIIDIIWHEHLLFSSGYKDFCKEVIEYEFDHHPELIAIDEQTEMYNAQYEYTLKLYRTEFGLEPPTNIWGETKYANNELSKATFLPKKKKQEENSGGSSNDYDNDITLVAFFYHEIAENNNDFGEFGGGDGGGSGASGEWGDANASDDGTDVSADGGGDGSGCSSGCGGGD